MSEEAKGGAPKKLTTAEILAMARAKAGGATHPAPAAAPKEESPAPAAATSEAVAETPAAAPAPKPAAAKPKSTADILAAARAAKAGASAAAPAAAAPPAKPSAPAAGGAKPKSTADILAAARAAKAGAAGAAPAAAPEAAVAKAATQPAAAAKAATGMSVQEMLAAMRPAGESAQAAAVAEKEKPSPAVAPPMPAKPLPAKKPGAKAGAEGATRRGFLLTAIVSFWVVAWSAFVGAMTIGSLGVLRFMLPNVLTEPPRKFKIGTPGDYDLGTVATKWVAQYGVWVVHTDQYQGKNLIYALISVCTHLGCTPSWLEGEQKFKCPCHGSGFYITGVNFEGPAPRPLERAGIRIAEDGMLEVDKSLKFQEEMGQWSDPGSFVAIS